MRTRALSPDAPRPTGRAWATTLTSCLTVVLLGLGAVVGVPVRAADSLTVSFVTAWGSLGSGNGQFNSPPAAVAVAPDGSVYVADYGERVQRFTGSGGYLTQWTGGGQGVAVGADGSVYVAGGDQVQKFAADGTPLLQWGSSGTGAGEFNGAWGVAVGPDGSVYVTEVANSRVQKFAVRIPQVLTFTSAPPADARVGGSYLVSVAGGGSGNPVVLTVDAAATAVCSIAGSTVSLVGAGTCIVNANQAGNDRYTPAPQVQQSFTVQAAPPPVAVTRTPTLLSLDVRPEPAVKGASVKAKAKLRTAAGPLANRVVRFYFRSNSRSSWAFRATVTTNSRGVAVRRFTARRSGAWSVRYAGSPAFLPDSATDRVKVLD